MCLCLSCTRELLHMYASEEIVAWQGMMLQTNWEGPIPWQKLPAPRRYIAVRLEQSLPEWLGILASHCQEAYHRGIWSCTMGQWSTSALVEILMERRNLKTSEVKATSTRFNKKVPVCIFFNTFWQHCSDETSRGVIVDSLLLSVKISTL